MTSLHNVEQLRLSIRASAGRNKLLWLRPGQSTTVGGTLAAQFTIRDDASLSAVHFAVECLRQQVRVRDLNSNSGTLLNGRRIESADLHDGDVILAGATAFDVSLDYLSNVGEDVSSPLATCIARSYANGLVSHRGQEGDAGPLKVVQALAEIAPLYVVADFRRLDRSPWSGAPYLVDWAPRELLPSLSPVVVPQRELSDFPGFFQQAWGSDAMTCVFSTLGFSQLLNHLRLAARGQRRTASVAEPRHMLGAMRPSELRSVLPSSDAGYAEFIYGGVSAVFAEGKSASHWEIVAPRAFTDALKSLGIHGAEVDEPDPASEVGVTGKTPR